jgi:hypothetical protein
MVDVGGVAPDDVERDVGGLEDDAIANEVPVAGLDGAGEEERRFEEPTGLQRAKSIMRRQHRLQLGVQLVAVERQIQDRRVQVAVGTGAAAGGEAAEHHP